MENFKRRQHRSPQGRKKLVREREEYFRLMKLGSSNRAACQAVGVNPRTGKRWRNGTNPTGNRPATPPIKPEPTPSGPSRYLHEPDRIHIADRIREGATVRAIATELGRSPSTISREIRRNGNPTDGPYRPHAAQARADARRPRPKHGKIEQNPLLRALIQRCLNLRWSPEQISSALRKRFPHQTAMHVVHETIYQALYRRGPDGLSRHARHALRTGRIRRKPRRQAQQRQPRFAAPMVMISERPDTVEDRKEPGHWEGDLVIGKNGASAIGTLVERTTRSTLLIHLPRGRSADLMRDALVDTMGTLPAHLRRSLTWDQGSEMGCHHDITNILDMPIYFCNPASPWQRGTNENTNGLLRQYFPKGADLSVHSFDDLAAVSAEFNNRPRKTLGWDTPRRTHGKTDHHIPGGANIAPGITRSGDLNPHPGTDHD